MKQICSQFAIVLTFIHTKLIFVESQAILTPVGLIPADYDHFAPPVPKPVVQVDLIIKSLMWTHNKIHVILRVRQRWQDSRLVLHKSVATSKFRRSLLLNHIWTPHPLIDKSDSHLINDGMLTWKNTGEIEQVLDFQVDMYINRFKSQEVHGQIYVNIRIGDFVHNADEITLEWENESDCAKLNDISFLTITDKKCSRTASPVDEREQLVFYAMYKHP